MKGKKRHEASQEISDVKKNIQCSICFEIFLTKNNLKEHFSKAHKDKKFNCLYCSAKFNYMKDCSIHLSDVHGVPNWSPNAFVRVNEKFKCPICLKVFVNQHTLKRHTSQIHEKNKPFQCISCPKRFGIKSELERHFKKVHE